MIALIRTMTFITVLILLSVFQAALAEDIQYTDQYSVCINNSHGVTVSMLNCIGEEMKKQDMLLNKAYKASMSQLTAVRKKQLKHSQRSWIQYRKANCSFYADQNDGSSANLIFNDCFLTTTVSRVKELESFYE